MDIPTPRPTIVVSGSQFEYKKSVACQRQRQMKLAMPQVSKSVRARMSYVVNKYRKKQRKMMEDDDIEDPNPYDDTYVFYCLEGACV